MLIGLFFIGSPIIGLLTDARWFESLGAGALFWQRLQIQGTLFVLAALAALAFLLITVLLAGLISRRQGGGDSLTRGRRRVRRVQIDHHSSTSAGRFALTELAMRCAISSRPAAEQTWAAKARLLCALGTVRYALPP